MLNRIATTFRENCDDVERLLHFDRDVLQLVIHSIESLHEHWKTKTLDERYNGKRVLDMTRNVQRNDSLRARYRTVYGQAVVLLVSHFASALGDIFRAAVTASLDGAKSEALLEEEVKLTFQQMKEQEWNLRAVAADLLIAKKDYTFQDMQSVSRAFRSYLDVDLKQDAVTNDIILGQAARHAIVHAGAIASDKTVRQLANAKPRELKPSVAQGDKFEFSVEEVLLLKRQMLTYIDRTIAAVEAKA